MASLASTSRKSQCVQPLFSYARLNRRHGLKLATGVRFASAESNDGKGRSGPPAPKHKRTKPTSGTFKTLPSNNLANIKLFQEQTINDDVPLLQKSSVSAASVGSLVRFPTGGKTPISNFGLPRKVFIEQRMLSQPLTVVRKSTVNLTKILEDARHTPSTDTRLVMTGSSGCGKSLVMLQAVTYCQGSEWIVLYIPRANKLVDSSSSFAYDSQSQTYVQSYASQQILKRFKAVNQDLLQSLKLSKDIPLERRRSITAGTDLNSAIELALNDLSHAPIVLSTLVTELASQSQYPVLIAIDDFQALYCTTLYRDPQFAFIQPYHLSVPRLLLEYANGSRSLARGAVLGALSMSDTQFPLPLELQEALALIPESRVSPYVHRSPELVHYTQGLKPWPVPDKLDLTEAAAIFNMWTKDRALHSPSSDEFFLAKYTESSGNARDFVRGGLLAALGS